jgi:hypothetical protein
MDVPSNINAWLQGVGRCWRLGQQKTVLVFNLSVMHTADQRFGSKLAEKTLGQLAGQIVAEGTLPEHTTSEVVYQAIS